MNSSTLSQGLIAEFKGHGKNLNPHAGINVNAPGKAWTIFDANNEYFVRSEHQLLYVYLRNQPRPLNDRPVVDPDIIDQYDLLDRKQNPQPVDRTQWNAADLFTARRDQLNQAFNEIKAYRESNNLKKLLGPISQLSQPQTNHSSIHDLDYITLLNLRSARDRGTDIAPRLQVLKLGEDEFDYLSRIVEIDNAGQPILDSEWENLYNLIVQRIKQYELYSNWITEEQQIGAISNGPWLTLSPDRFRLRPSDPGTDIPAWVPTPWCSDEAVRRQWESILRARSDQMQSITTGMQSAVDNVESELLARLRDDLLAAARPGPGTLGLENFGQHLQINVRADTCQMTTRLAQAIETMQGLLFGAHNGLLNDDSITLEADHFDEQWKWLGSYATWRAAMLVFLYPENTLRPTLLNRKSPAFETLINDLRDLCGTVTETDVRDEADKYELYFKDICSLSCAGLRQTAGLIPHEQPYPRMTGETSPWWDIGDVLAIGRGEATGGYYVSSWVRQPGWGLKGSPVQSLWQPVTNLAKFSQIVGMVPFQNTLDSTNLAVYFRARAGASYQYQVVRHDGQTFGAPESIDMLPKLLCSSQYVQRSLPLSPALSKANVNPWTLDPNDQVVIADLDGDGRSEIILISGVLGSNGRRRLGVLCEWGGGLRLDWDGYIDDGWRVPDPERPVLFQVILNDVPWPVQRLLIVNPSGPRLATLGWVDGNLEVINATDTISGPTGNWKVSLSTKIDTKDQPTVFIAASLGGGQKLVVFDYQEDPTLGITVDFKTVAHVMSWQNQTFVLSSTQEVLGVDKNPHPDPFNIEWQVFHPVRSGYLPTGSFGGDSRDDIFLTGIHTGCCWLGLLRWDDTKNLLSVPPSVIYWGSGSSYSGWQPLVKNIPGINGQSDWQLDNYDEFYSYETGTASAGIIVRSPVLSTDSSSPSSMGVLAYQPGGTLAVVWRTSKQIQSASASISPWDLHQNDCFYIADIDGDGVSELVIFRPDTTSPLAICTIQSDGSILVSWRSPSGTISFPFGHDLDGWYLSGNNRFLVADLDDDGYPEILGINLDSTDLRLGVLHPMSDPIQPRLQDLPKQFPPFGVTDQDITNQFPGAARMLRRQQIENAYNANLLRDGQGNESYLGQTYLDEAYYFVPIEIALRLSESGNYAAALEWLRSVYDYDLPIDERKIAYSLILDAGTPSFERGLDWLDDPLNPHAIAATRKNSYTKYTLLLIVHCLLDYADAEFTRATSESVPRARELYMKALQLLDGAELNQHTDKCLDLIGNLSITVGSAEDIWVLDQIKRGLAQINNYSVLADAVKQIQPLLASHTSPVRKLAQAEKILSELTGDQIRPATLDQVLSEDARLRRKAVSAVLTDGNALKTVTLLGAAGGIFVEIDLGHWEHVPAPELIVCIPLNRAIQTARDHVLLNLHKIDTCRNIAGMELELEHYGGMTAMMVSSGDQLPSPDMTNYQPLPYRYTTLIERAKQLVDLARQIEASMLNFIEKVDLGRYEELKARQDLGLAQAGLRLKDLQLVEANDNVGLAQLQRERAVIQKNEYTSWLQQGISALEYLSLANMGLAAINYSAAAALSLSGSIASAYSPEAVASWWGSSAGQMASAASSFGQMHSTMSSILSTFAGYERRSEEWRLQLALAAQDVSIGQQQITLANDRVNIAGQERAISNLHLIMHRLSLTFSPTSLPTPTCMIG